MMGPSALKPAPRSFGAGARMTPVPGAIRAEPKARQTFDNLATFYRKGFVDWVEGAKRPETRSNRIAETVAALRAGRRER